MSRTKIYALLCLLLFAAYMRVEVTRLTQLDAPMRSDAREYVLYGYNLMEFGVYSGSDIGLKEGASPPPNALRPPGYPLFMATFMALLGEDAALVAVKWAQTLLSILVVALVFLLARWCLPWWPAFVVAFLAAVSPHLININLYWLTESLFTFLLMLSLVLFAALVRKRRSVLLAVLCGLAFGYCYLTRPTVALFLLPVLALLYFHRRADTPRLASIIVLAAALSPLLWAVSYSPDADVSAGTLLRGSIHHGMYPGFSYGGQAESYPAPYRYDPRSEEISASWGSLGEELWRRFTEETGRHLYWFLIGKPLALLDWDTVQAQGGSYLYPVIKSPYAAMEPFYISHLATGYAHNPLMWLAVLGSALVWLATWQVWVPRDSLLVPQLASLLLLYFIGIHMVVAPFPRYAIPLRPICYLLAVWVCWALWQRAFGRDAAEETLRE